MKLRRHPFSYNGQVLDADEFAFAPGDGSDPSTVEQIVLPCRGGKYRNCMLYVTTGEAAHPRWHWDGNADEPTLTPSIGCDNRCGWHGHLTKGEMKG